MSTIIAILVCGHQKLVGKGSQYQTKDATTYCNECKASRKVSVFRE